jgi:hypothetical protein
MARAVVAVVAVLMWLLVLGCGDEDSGGDELGVYTGGGFAGVVGGESGPGGNEPDESETGEIEPDVPGSGETGSDESGSDESGSDESGSEETGGEETGDPITPPPPEPIVVERRVDSSADDAEEQPDGKVVIISQDLDLVTSSEVQTVGVRFKLKVPPDATIVAAFIRFQVDEVSVEPASLTLRAQLVNDAGDFEVIPHHVTMRPLTKASVNWEPSPWDVLEATHDTPSLVDLVQEVVTHSGWEDGNDIAFVITGSGARTAKAFDGPAGEAGAPLLHVEYLPPACEADGSCLADPGVITCPFIGDGDQAHPSDAFFDRDQVVRIDLEMDPADWQFQLDNPDLEQYVPAALEFCGQRLEGVGMRFKKSTHPKADLPEGYKKNPMVFDLNEFNPGQKLRGLRKINIEYGNDQELVAQRLNWEMLADFGLNVSRVNSTRLFVNGEYIGVFTNIERVDRSYAKFHFGENDGQLYKHAYCGTFKYQGDDASAYTSDPRCYAPKPNDSVTDYSDIIEVMNQLNNTPASAFSSVFPQIWDVDEWIPTTAALQVIPYGDSPNANANNFYTYHPADGGPARFALWDLDAGYWSTVQPCEKGADSIHWDLYRYSKCYQSLPLFERMIEVPEWNQTFQQAAYDFVVGPFAPAAFQARADALVALLAGPLSEDPNRSGDDAEWSEGVQALISAQASRADAVKSQLEGMGFTF